MFCKALTYVLNRLELAVATIHVGEQAESFIVHRDLITASSDFFAKALTGEFKEKDSIVRLEGHETSHFATYFQWLNSGQSSNEHDFDVLSKLYALGYFIQDRHFRNATIDKLIGDTVRKRIYPIDLACFVH
jgi:hypothetical protein